MCSIKAIENYLEGTLFKISMILLHHPWPSPNQNVLLHIRPLLLLIVTGQSNREARCQDPYPHENQAKSRSYWEFLFFMSPLSCRKSAAKGMCPVKRPTCQCPQPQIDPRKTEVVLRTILEIEAGNSDSVIRCVWTLCIITTITILIVIYRLRLPRIDVCASYESD